MKKKIILIILIAIFLLVAICTITVATDLQDLQNRKNELQTQISDANSEINDIQIELTENLEQLNNLNEKIFEYEDQVKVLEANLSEIQVDVDEVTKKLDNIKLDYNLQRQVLEKRLVALYEAGQTRYLDVLLSSSSISEFISNYYLISEVASYDEELLDNIEREKNSIQTIQETLNQKKENLKLIIKSKETTTIALENSKILKNTYIAKLTNQEKETQSKIDAFQAEMNSIENQIEVSTTGKVGEDYVGGELAWPAPGYTTITSTFGMRYHPIFKVYRMHTGTDIGMPTGAYIVAANDGVVTKAYYTTGYGNMVMIDHGGGVSTVYGHGSEILVQAGQEVKRGETIMKAGSTGWSTGPHLHFEVRLNGKYVDPLPYITHEASLETKESENQNTIEMQNNI